MLILFPLFILSTIAPNICKQVCHSVALKETLGSEHLGSSDQLKSTFLNIGKKRVSAKKLIKTHFGIPDAEAKTSQKALKWMQEKQTEFENSLHIQLNTLRSRPNDDAAWAQVGELSDTLWKIYSVKYAISNDKKMNSKWNTKVREPILQCCTLRIDHEKSVRHEKSMGKFRQKCQQIFRDSFITEFVSEESALLNGKEFQCDDYALGAIGSAIILLLSKKETVSDQLGLSNRATVSNQLEKCLARKLGLPTRREDGPAFIYRAYKKSIKALDALFETLQQATTVSEMNPLLSEIEAASKIAETISAIAGSVRGPIPKNSHWSEIDWTLWNDKAPEWEAKCDALAKTGPK